MNPLMMGRRQALRALGTLIALPFMESIAPKIARAAALPQPRFINYYVPCGYNMSTYVPIDQGNTYTLSPCLTPLAAFRSQMLVLSNLNNEDSLHPSNTRNGDHAIGTSAYGTYNRLADGGGIPAANAKSVDQYAADAIAVPGNRLKSLQIGINTTQALPDGFGGAFPALFTATNSWATPTSPNTYLDNPSDVFNSIFGDAVQSASGPTDADLARAAARKSILDAVIDQATTLKNKLGALDAIKLDQYLTEVRAVEAQVVDLTPSATCVNPGSQSVTTASLNDTFNVMTKLAALALQCDATRVVNFMAGPGQSQTVFGNLGITDIHHNISHHGGDPVKLGQLTAIVTYEMQQVGALCTALQQVTLSDGTTLLDNTILVQSSEMGDPNLHDHKHTPAVLIGGSNVGMNYQGGSCVAYGDDGSTYLASMWLAVLDKLGAAPAALGNMASAPISSRLAL